MNVNYTLLIQTPLDNIEISDTAKCFAQKLLSNGHTIHRIFFYGDGVEQACDHANPPTSESLTWASLIESFKLDAVVCSTASQKKGLWYENAPEKNRIPSPFSVSGLGQLVEACTLSDRTVTFL